MSYLKCLLVLEHGQGVERAARNRGHGNLDAHLVVHVAGLATSVLATGRAGAAAVVHDDDLGGLVGLVHLGSGGVGAEQGGGHRSGSSENNGSTRRR